MDLISEIAQRRAANAKRLAAFGILATPTAGGLAHVVREGSTAVTVYTIGYEGRDGDALIHALRNQGVRALADIRERPVSRKPDFRAGALRTICVEAGIEYQPWSQLGSTIALREELHESGDFQTFATQFRSHAISHMMGDLNRLAVSVKAVPTALLC